MGGASAEDAGLQRPQHGVFEGRHARRGARVPHMPHPEACKRAVHQPAHPPAPAPALPPAPPPEERVPTSTWPVVWLLRSMQSCSAADTLMAHARVQVAS